MFSKVTPLSSRETVGPQKVPGGLFSALADDAGNAQQRMRIAAERRAT